MTSPLPRIRILLHRCQLGAHHLCNGTWGLRLECGCPCHHPEEKK